MVAGIIMMPAVVLHFSTVYQSPTGESSSGVSGGRRVCKAENLHLPMFTYRCVLYIGTIIIEPYFFGRLSFTEKQHIGFHSLA